MAITDLIKRTVLTEFRVDTHQADRELDGLIEKNKKLGSATLEAAKGQAAHLDGFTASMKGAGGGIQDFIGKLSPWKQAFEMASKAVDYAQDALKSYGETLRLESKTAGINISKIEDAFDGLISHHDALQFAAQTSTGVLRLNQQQMETLAHAAVALRENGFEDLDATMQKLTDSVVKGNVDGFKELGIDLHAGASKAETLKNMMTELNKVIAESGPQTQHASDDVDRLAKGWDNATEKAKEYTAQAILALGDGIDVWDWRAMEQKIRSKGWDDFRNMFPDDSYYKMQHKFAVGFNRGKQQVLDSQVIEMGDLNVGRTDAERQQLAAEAIDREARAILRAAIASSDRNVASAGGFARSGSSLGSSADSTIRDEYGNADSTFDLGSIISTTDATNQATLAEQGSRDSRYASSYSSRTQSYLETMFGPIEDFKAYETAFGSLQLATSSAMGAWISGSMSLGLAIKKGIGDALGALASQLMVEGVKHGAYALGSLAFGDFSGAARHGAAAAAFGSGAVAAAVAAKKLGGSVAADIAAAKAGSSSAGAGGSSGGSSAGAGSGGSGGGGVINHYTIVYGESFYSESARMKQLDADRMVRQALGSSYVEHS
jgi:hypothetical protein